MAYFLHIFCIFAAFLLHIKCIFNAYLCILNAYFFISNAYLMHIYAYIMHIFCILLCWSLCNDIFFAYLLHIYCIFTAYVVHISSYWMRILSIYMHILCIWFDWANSKMIYKQKANQQVLYVLPIIHILGKLSLVPVGDKGTFPHSMRWESAEFPWVSCDSDLDKGDGCKWWYVNSWAMTWSSQMEIGWFNRCWRTWASDGQVFIQEGQAPAHGSRSSAS